ncbi:MAG: response regulator [Anaerostipes sp.]|nr:response regulator [Anaerostipes sp.]
MKKHNYDKKIFHYRLYLAGVIVLTFGIAAAVVWMGIGTLNKEANQFSGEIAWDYDNLIDSYETTFRVMAGQIKEKIKENPSLDEMNQWLQSKQKYFEEQIGIDAYDGVALTYKGGYAHSWNIEDNDDYEPSTRPWYRQAQRAKGKVTVVAPYTNYLGSLYDNEDEAIVMTIAQKYNKQISIHYDIKITQIGKLVQNRIRRYDNSKIILYDRDGYILSSTDDKEFGHNIYNPDQKISEDLSKKIKKSRSIGKSFILSKVDGELRLLYSSRDKNGNTLCISYSFWTVMVDTFAVVGLIVGVLILLEIFMYIRNKRYILEFHRRDRRLSHILNASYDKELFVYLDSMEFYGNEEAQQLLGNTKYKELYQYMYDIMEDNDSKYRFAQFLSPEALRNEQNEKEILVSQKFNIKIDLTGKEQKTIYEIYRMITKNDDKMIAAILVNDVTEDATILREALQRAEQASEAKGNFLTKMSHEIRTPMNAIIGETTLALRQMDQTDKVEICLEKVMISSKHLLNLINDILDMSSIESNKMKIAHAEFDIKEVVSTVSTLYYSQCKEKGIEFKTKLDEVRTEILVGDQLRIQQIILNLLSNAVKFTSRGGEIIFALSEDNISGKNLDLHIHIMDTGAGMSKEYMNRIFQPFEQEHALTAKEHGGSGLGLSITKNLMELMNGSITVESEEGKGTVFDISIPCEIAENQVRMDTSLISSMRAIVVDDDKDTLDYIGNILNHIGISHDCVTCGKDAIEMITKARNDKKMYDVCLLDWRMKGISGLELAEKIRLACGDQPIILIASAYDLNEINDDAKKAGVDMCVAKPIFQSSLFNMLMKLNQGKLVHQCEKKTDYDFTGKRILLVDDTEINLEIAKELLEMVNFKVDVAWDGKEALNMFEKSKPGTYNVILMDVQMPVMNGYEATRAIRGSKHSEAKSICVIAMTANAFAEDIAKSMQAGMDDHISKPIDTELMYDILNRYV